MSPAIDRGIYGFTSHYFNFDKKKINIINNINNNTNNNYYYNVLKDFASRYKNLPEDVKNLCDFAENMKNLVFNLESKLSNLRKDYDELQKNLFKCRQELSKAETRIVEASGNSTLEDNICIICMTNPRECAYVKCGHICACIDCCERMETQCPICRQNGNYIKLIRV